ncbi:AvrD family protein [Streptomyces sp. 6N223]|uniref:AvrD family protein n=1 Tax=Streptomyces sp. 6N223 TaxID=3457412 RepID=UPI003FD12D3B
MTTALRFTSIDDFLGDGRKRYFSQGFKRVSQRLTGIAVGPGEHGAGQVAATAAVTYPADWSRKNAAMDLRPHLSSVDAMVIGVQLAEIHLTHAHRLTPEQRRACWLRRFVMRSGGRPQESLASFPVTAVLRETRPRHGLVRPAVSTFDIGVGGMRIACEVEHDLGDRAFDDAWYDTAEDVLGDAADRYYGDGFRARDHDIREVDLAPDGSHVRAVAAIADARVSREGFGAAYQPSRTMVDCFLALAQLAQLLIYHEDNLSRGQSNTLWMRRLTMTCDRPDAPLGEALPLAVHRERSDFLDTGDGQWRKADMTGDFQSVQARSSMAHRLPA